MQPLKIKVPCKGITFPGLSRFSFKIIAANSLELETVKPYGVWIVLKYRHDE